MLSITDHSVANAQRAPRFSKGVTYSGPGKFSSFITTPTTKPVGESKGYASLDDAVNAATTLTVGAHLPAAGIYERSGRYYAREMKVDLVFANGNKWSGPWRLEQNPGDGKMFDGSLRGDAYRTASLVAVVDGAQHLDLINLPTNHQRARR